MNDELVICLSQINFGENSAPSERGKQVTYLRQRISIQSHCSVRRDLEVTTYSHCAVFLEDWNDRSCPAAILHLLQDPAVDVLLKLKFHLLLKHIWQRMGFTKSWRHSAIDV